MTAGPSGEDLAAMEQAENDQCVRNDHPVFGLTSAKRWFRLPGVAIEIGLGIVIEPKLLDWAHLDDVIRVLAEMGLVFLIVLAGFEVDPNEVKGRPDHRVGRSFQGRYTAACSVNATEAGAICNAEQVHPPWPTNPVVHEIFTWVWLSDLERTLGRHVTLDTVPDEVWDDVARPGIDAVWLMGVWSRSAVGAEIARVNPAMQRSHHDTLADLTDTDVVGSAYCIREYHVDDHLGGDRGLAIARTALAARGVRLVLDFVPNHVAPDHPWVTTHPEWFILGTQDDIDREPDGYLRVGDFVLACGRDPNFPAWPEVVQLDASHVGLRTAMADLVVSLTDRCDGLRCDMAMLVLDDVFRRTWGSRATGGGSPDSGRGFWPTVIARVKASRPDFAMWAEAYWDLEPVLLEQGFDACYDKRLYDRIIHHASVSEIRAHLAAPVDQQQRMVRFVENHDEISVNAACE